MTVLCFPNSTKPCTWRPTRAFDRSTCPCALTGTTVACGAFTTRTAAGTNRPRPVNRTSPGKYASDPNAMKLLNIRDVVFIRIYYNISIN